MSTTYRLEKNAQLREKSMLLLEQLPMFCTDYLISIERNLVPQTVYTYLQRLLVFFKYLETENSYFGKRNINDYSLSDMELLTAEDINMFCHFVYSTNQNNSKKSNKETTVDNYLAALNSLWMYFVTYKGFKNNPIALIKRSKRKKKEIIRLESHEKANFMQCVENGKGFDANQLQWNERTKIRDIAICKVLLGTGIRVSELVGLDVDDIDFQKKCFKVIRKGDKFDVVYFNEEVADALDNYLDERVVRYQPCDDENALFLVGIGKYKGTRLSVKSVERIVKKFALAGVPLKGSLITPHKLRATYGTSLYKQTGDIYLVAEVLGHKDVNTAKHYTAIDEERKRKAALEHVDIHK